jgi:Reverse transcriptase (RNA-dependent DNA polymerase)
LKHKSDVCNDFSLFKSQVENLFTSTIKILRTDGGAEYKPIITQFPQLIHQTTCPHTPQQNGLAETKHRHIVELSLATIAHASIPLKYWDEIFSSIVYLINRLPSQNNIPYKVLFNKEPNYHFLKVLGCLCFPLTRPYNNNKLEFRSKLYIFIGHGIHQKGYRCLHLDTNRIFISRNVQFNESNFPFKDVSHSSQEISLDSFYQASMPILLAQPASTDASLPLTQDHPILDPPQLPSTSTGPPIVSSLAGPSSSNCLVHTPPLSFPSPRPVSQTRLQQPISLPNSVIIHTAPSSSMSPSHSPVSSSQLPRNIHSMVTRTKDSTHPAKKFPDFVVFHSSIDPDPTSFTQVAKSSNWRDAMANEINALAKNNTWTLVTPPTDQKIIGYKWVFKTKRKPDGSVDRFKARLVAKGYNQEPGIDFEETYSHVIRATIIRVILSIVISSN